MTLTSTPPNRSSWCRTVWLWSARSALPSTVSAFGRQSSRPDDVREQHGGEHATGIEHRSDAGHEVLDLGDDRILVAGPDEVVGTGKLDVSRVRDMFGEVPPMRDAEPRRGRSVDDQRRDTDRRQDIADVALVDQADDRLGAARRRGAALVAGPGATDALVAGDGRREQVDHHAPPRIALGDLERWRQCLDRGSDREVGSLEETREAVDEDEARDPFRMRRGERHRQDPAADVGDQRRSVASDRVEHGRDIGHELLEGRKRRRRDRVREARPPLVEHDQPAERRQALAKGGKRRHVPLGIEIAEPLVEQQDVGRSVAHDLVGQVELAEPGVAGLRKHALQA